MAITFGNTSENGTQGTTSWSHNNNGDFLFIGVSSTTDNITGVTYNGVSMTQIGTSVHNATLGRYVTIWGLASPTSGSNTVAITGGANQTAAGTSISGYNSNSGFNSGSTISATPVSVGVTTTVDNAFVVGFGIFVTFSSLGTGVSDIDGAVNGDTNVRLIKSTSAVTPAGVFTMAVNMSGSNLGLLAAVGVNPVAAAVNSNFFQFM